MLQQFYDDENIQFEAKWNQTKQMWIETREGTINRKTKPNIRTG